VKARADPVHVAKEVVKEVVVGPVAPFFLQQNRVLSFLNFTIRHLTMLQIVAKASSARLFRTIFSG
jgi:hypothetical protein